MPTRTPRQRLPAAQRRELIIDAALAEFAERGYEAASIGRIAQAAGVSRTVLYDHFPNKLALFVALERSEHRILLDYQSAALQSEGSTEARWRATFDAFFRFVEERPLAWDLLYPTRIPLDPDADREHRRLRTESNRMLAELLAADARRAGLEPETVRARAVFVMHRDALEGGARWWRAHPHVTRAEMVDAAIDALWTGFGGLQPPHSAS
jgi:AcrR family transcriptional regulator